MNGPDRPAPYVVAAIVAAICAVVAAILTGIIRNYAIRNQLLDRPNLRSSHSVPTPRGGGAAVVVVAVVGLAVGALFGAIDLRQAVTLELGVVALGWAGWADDATGLHPRIRLAIHFAVAAWTVLMFRGLPFIRLGVGSIPLGYAGYIVAVLGIVWCINLFNFMDGIDGLAGSQAVLIFGVLSGMMVSGGNRSLGLVAAIIAGASMGFLVWNWPPAKIFLGDVGSGALGYLIAAIAVASENSGGVPLLIVGLIGAVFVVDATATLLRRLARGHSPAEAHRDHAYQRLARAWKSHRHVTVAAAAATIALSAVGAIAMERPPLLLPALGFGWGLLALALFLLERHSPMFQ